MARSSISLVEANKLLRSVFDLPVSLPWKGHGSAIFLELGNLAPLSRPKQRRQSGDVTIYVGWTGVLSEAPESSMAVQIAARRLRMAWMDFMVPR